MRPTPYVASLRVYEPITSFEPVEQLRWNSIPITTSTGQEEQERALARTITVEPPSLRPDGAHIIEFEGARYVAPWSTATRCWTALDSFKDSIPASIVRYFVPSNMEEAILINSEIMEDKIPHILTETWLIPPRWFGLFEADERLRARTDDGPYVVHRTSIANAKKRCMRLHEIVVASFGEGPVEGEIADLLEWLDLFHPDSLVELDYGGLAIFMELALQDEGGLEADTSVEDLHHSLRGLEQGNGAMAGQGYEALIGRWRKISAFEQSS
jgi:hypothetical protein